VFNGAAAAGCGETKGVSRLTFSFHIPSHPTLSNVPSTQQQGINKVEAGTKAAMALSGNQLPQISPGGSVSGTLHIVTSDGAGPYTALIDSTGTGNFADAATMTVLTQVPGNKGNIKKSKAKRGLAGLWDRAVATLMRRATNINEDFVSVPPWECRSEDSRLTRRGLAVQGRCSGWHELHRHCSGPVERLHG
jgi:Egh16-like virulence factor